MTLSIKHKFQSAKADGADASVLRPSNWNDEHDIQLATNTVVGRATAGAGSAEEIPCTAIARQILASTDVAAVLAVLGIAPPTTGDVQFTIKQAADVPSGWLLMDDGTVGDANSGASSRAHADCEKLFKMLWRIPDAYAPVTGGRGLTADADWAAHKKIALTKVLGRTLAVAGAGTGLSNRALGLTVGDEAHTLQTENLPAHDHGIFLKDPGHAHAFSAAFMGGQPTAGGAFAGVSASSSTTSPANTGVTLWSGEGGTGNQNKTATTGSATPVTIMQPTSFLNVMIRL